jgi:hypothetical protein
LDNDSPETEKELSVKDKLAIHVEYKNKRLETTGIREFPLDEYIAYVKAGILRILMDVEDMIYEFEGGKGPDEWSAPSFRAFQKIRHKLLDRAGEIQRIPDSIHIKE